MESCKAAILFSIKYSTTNNISNKDGMNGKDLKLLKTWKAVKPLFCSASNIQNPFEFPRQQGNEDNCTPEVAQFKSSFKVYNPNKPPPAPTSTTTRHSDSTKEFQVEGSASAGPIRTPNSSNIMQDSSANSSRSSSRHRAIPEESGNHIRQEQRGILFGQENFTAINSRNMNQNGNRTVNNGIQTRPTNVPPQQPNNGFDFGNFPGYNQDRPYAASANHQSFVSNRRLDTVGNLGPGSYSFRGPNDALQRNMDLSEMPFLQHHFREPRGEPANQPTIISALPNVSRRRYQSMTENSSLSAEQSREIAKARNHYATKVAAEYEEKTAALYAQLKRIRKPTI
uniref:Uncharacterized protein n=1 Tax=Panagrolaimus sp. ES5 TaxID=591445 RepID=A0AC34G0A6_9BILA